MRARALLLLIFVSALSLWMGDVACSGGSNGPGTDGGSSDVAVPPDSQNCTGDATRCLFGTVVTVGMTAKMQAANANLYRVFPSNSGMVAEAQQLVAKDGTWAFSGLDPWAHYFVQIDGNFGKLGDINAAKEAIVRPVGPLSVPSGGMPIATLVKPIEVQAYEQRQPAGQNLLVWVSAHVFDPTSGSELGAGANVAVVVSATSTPMSYGTNPSDPGAYYVAFSPPVPAATSYSITVSHPSFGSSPATFQIVADPPNFDAALTSPASGGTITVGQPVTATWTTQPSVDYEVLEWFFQQMSMQGPMWERVYASSPVPPEGPDSTTATVPMEKVASPGMYLLNVAFAKANCPASYDGCVYGNSVASAQLTAQ
jgi:hypothetical protein